MADSWYRVDEGRACISLTVHVQPNARATEVAGLYGEALRIRIAAPAVDDKANMALLDFLRKALGLPRSALSIRHGTRGRHKVVEIAGAEPALRAKLAALAR